MSNILEELSEKYNPSKRKHDYIKHYWRHFGDIRFKVKKVCEIGLQRDSSLKMWEEFFPSSMIYGIDIDPQCKEFEGDRRKVYIGDQSDIDFLDYFLADIGGGIDIVVDDGSHDPRHQLTSFAKLFPSVSEHGIYVIEDTGGVVGDINQVTINAMKGLVDCIMYWPKGVHSANWEHIYKFPPEATWLDRHIVGMAFYRWIVFIMKGNNPGDNPFLHPPSHGDEIYCDEDVPDPL